MDPCAPPNPALPQARKQEATRRRKLITEKKLEQAKQTTVQKLLQKQTSSKMLKQMADAAAKDRTAAAAKKIGAKEFPMLRYVNNKDTLCVAAMHGATFPLKRAVAKSYPGPRETCAAAGCTNPRRYATAKAALPVCSLACYKVVNVA